MIEHENCKTGLQLEPGDRLVAEEQKFMMIVFLGEKKTPMQTYRMAEINVVDTLGVVIKRAVPFPFHDHEYYQTA